MSDAHPLWRCPECGRQFASRNQWHSCTTMTVEEHLGGKTPLAVELFHAFEAAVKECGSVRLHPGKTRIGFITRMTFAGVTLRQRWIDVAFILPNRLDNERIQKIESFGHRTHVHHLRLRDPGEIDAELRGWLVAAYKVGLQEPPADRTFSSPRDGPDSRRARDSRRRRPK